MKKVKSTYSLSGVDYKKIDPLKRVAQTFAKSTDQNSNIKVVKESRGESAFVWEEKDSYKAFVIEGLGTKNLIADEMRKVTKKTYYDNLAQDTIAMIVNDLSSLGATPQVINAYFAAGSSEWFSDKKRIADLVKGWAKTCKMTGAIWGGGESPSLTDIINKDAIDLAGSAVGIIKPKKRLTLGDKISEGDLILLIESSGVHANGLSLVRKIIKNLKDGIKTKMKDGKYFAEEILTPTYLYSNLVQDLFQKNIDIHYMINITGHGWRKLMRANRNFTYLITQISPTPPIFQFIQENGNLSDYEMYETFNMGAGFAIIIPPADKDRALQIIKKVGFKVFWGGIVQKGERQVVIKPKNIKFSGETLDLR